MTREEFINEINNNKHYSLQDIQIPDAKLVDRGSYLTSNECNDKWHSISMNIYELEDGYVGVQGFNKCDKHRTVEIPCGAFPMKKVVGYVKE